MIEPTIIEPGQNAGQPRVSASRSTLYGNLPLAFEPNVGQADARVRFLARGGGMTAFFSDTETAMVLGRRRQKDKPAAPGHQQAAKGEFQQAVVRMKLAGASPMRRATGLEKLPGVSNYFMGSDPAKWRTDVPHYARIAYEAVYPGIDLVWYGNQRRLEYDFVVAPGADPKQIQIAYEGVESLQVVAGGELVLRTALGEVRQQKPRVYQDLDGQRVEVGARYALAAGNRVSFELARYDRKRELCIDPVVLVYSTYLGANGLDVGYGIAVDAAGATYVTGYTGASVANYPVAKFPTHSPYQDSLKGKSDAYVTKLTPDGRALVYSTYLGGDGDDSGNGLVVDAAGAAYIAGQTSSVNFPVKAAYQSTPGGGGTDAFVTKLTPAGNALVYSTYLGGGSPDYGHSIAVDTVGSAYVTGVTLSNNFPTLSAYQSAFQGGDSDAFVTKLTPDGSALVYSTYLGGSSSDHGHGIAVDSLGAAYISGSTASANFPTQSAVQAKFQGGTTDGFVTKLTPAGNALVYSTYLGGSLTDYAHDIAVDAAGSAYVTGVTASSNFPTQSAYQATYQGGGSDAFVTKLTPDGALAYSTYLGGKLVDQAFGIAVDAAGSAYVTGSTASANFPTLMAYQAKFLGGVAVPYDAYVTKLTPAGNALVYSTFLGGTDYDEGSRIAVDAAGSAYVAGNTSSANFPTKSAILGSDPVRFFPPNPYAEDAFVTKLSDASPTRTISHIANGAGWRTTAILINTGAQANSFELKLWDNTGNPLMVDLGVDGVTADLTGIIQPGVARFIRTAGTGGDLQAGWAELTASLDIDGNSIFGLQAPGQGDSEAAVPLSPSGGTQLFVPYDYSSGYSTGIAFADPAQQAATVSAVILDDAYANIPAANRLTVPARGHFSDVLASPFPGVAGRRGVAHFSANTNIFGLGIRANGKAFTSIDALSGITSAAKTIPHIANGGGWKTTFLIVSTDTQAANFTLKFWGDDGTALTLPLGDDGTVASIGGTLRPGEIRIIETTNTGALVTGWAELSGLTGAIGGTAIFALQTPGQSDSEAAVPFSTASSTQLFMPYDYSPGYSTAIAFTNTNAGQATINATFTDEGGHNLGSGQIQVPAHGHASAVLASVLADIAGTRGTVSLTSNVPVVGLGIRANGVAFTSLKVIGKTD